MDVYSRGDHPPHLHRGSFPPSRDPRVIKRFGASTGDLGALSESHLAAIRSAHARRQRWLQIAGWASGFSAGVAYDILVRALL